MEEDGTARSAPVLDGTTVDGLARLRQLVVAAAPCMVADLSLGLYQPFGMLHELGRQDPDLAALAEGATLRGVDMGALIQRGWAGDGAVMLARRAADRLASDMAAHGRSLLVLTPRFDLPWSQFDQYLLYFLGRDKRAAGRLRMLNWQGEPPPRSAYFTIGWGLPAWPFALPVSQPVQEACALPGLVCDAAARHYRVAPRRLVALAGGVAIVDPALRCDPRQAALDGQENAAWARRQAYFFTMFAPRSASPACMLRLAWEYALHGVERERVLYLCDRLRATLDRLGQGEREVVAQVAAQVNRLAIVMRDFSRPAALSPGPIGAMPAHYRYATGAYLALQRRPFLAAPYLDDEALFARELPPERFGFYLNLAAYRHFKAGATAKAFSLERRLETVLAARDDAWPVLAYLNRINLSRLYEAQGCAHLALYHTRRARAVWNGDETPFQAIAHLWREAKLLDRSGKRGEAGARRRQAAEAFRSLPVPEAFPDRLASVLTGVQSTANRLAMVERIGTRLRAAEHGA